MTDLSWLISLEERRFQKISPHQGPRNARFLTGNTKQVSGSYSEFSSWLLSPRNYMISTLKWVRASVVPYCLVQSWIWRWLGEWELFHEHVDGLFCVRPKYQHFETHCTVGPEFRTSLSRCCSVMISLPGDELQTCFIPKRMRCYSDLIPAVLKVLSSIAKASSLLWRRSVLLESLAVIG
jgi:hypothetical protein